MDVLVSKINEQIETQKNFLVGGSAKGFPEYRECVGVIRGLQLALRELETLIQLEMEADNER